MYLINHGLHGFQFGIRNYSNNASFGRLIRLCRNRVRYTDQDLTGRGFSNPLFLVMGDRNVPPPLLNLRSSAKSAVSCLPV